MSDQENNNANEDQLRELREQLEGERTARKRTENLLAEIKARYRSMLEFSPQIVIEVDTQGNVTYANPVVLELFGYPLDMIGTNITEFIPASDLEYERTVLRRGLSGGRDIIVSRVRDANGKIHHILNNSAPIYHDGQVEGLTIFGMDITERMEAAEALRESEERYRTLAEAARDFIYLIGREMVVRYVNNEGARQFHARPEDIIGKPLAALFPGTADRQEQNIRRVIETGEELYVENPVAFPTGDVWLSARLVPVRGGDGNISGVLGISRDITERKRTEEALRESENKYRTLVEAASDGIAILSDLKFVFSNNRLANMLGYTPDELVGKPYANIISPEQVPYIINDYRERRHRGEDVPNILETVLRDREGSDIPVEINVVTISYEPPRTALIMVRDITHRKQTENALRESEERLRSLFESAKECIYIKDSERRFVKVNPVLRKILGLEESDIIGRRLEDLFDTEYTAQIRKTDMRVLSGEYLDQEDSFEIHGIRYLMHATRAPIRSADGEVIGMCGIAREISDKRKIEQELRESEQKYRTLVEAASDGIAITQSRRFLFANKRLEEMIGREPGSLAGTPYENILTPEEVPYVINDFRERFLNNPNTTNMIETSLRHRDGSDIPVELNLATINYEMPRIILIMVRDITERRRAEQEKAALQQQLLQSQKMEAIGTLAGGMAHDFNNALAVILGTAEVALRKTEPGDPNYTRFEKIVRASDRARHITSKLLTFSRKQTLDVKPVAVGELAAEIVDMMRRSVSPDITIAVDSTPGCTAYVDPNQMHQALLNIMINACESMPGGGELRIRVNPVTITEDDKRSCGECTPGEFCLVQISDTGLGISESIIEKIFDPFFTTKDTGTGLGLSITIGIIKSHGGHVHVRSESGRGSEINVYLPALAQPPLPMAASDPEKAQLDRPQRVLIIDDEPAFTDSISEALDKAGFDVEVAPNGNTGVTSFAKRHADIDVVLLDLILPDSDGAAIFRALKRIDPDARVIVCSGCDIRIDTDELVDRGVRIFLPKPFAAADLVRKIEELLRV